MAFGIFVSYSSRTSDTSLLWNAYLQLYATKKLLYEIVCLRHGWTELFRITPRMWFETDISGLPIGPIFKDQAVQEKVWQLDPLSWDG
jgi:hypothetical protein